MLDVHQCLSQFRTYNLISVFYFCHLLSDLCIQESCALTLYGMRHKIFARCIINFIKELMMSCKGFLLLTVTIGLALFATAGISAQDEIEATAFYPETLYEFTPVLDGSKVVHEFVVQNKGLAPLNIERVKTG